MLTSPSFSSPSTAMTAVAAAAVTFLSLASPALAAPRPSFQNTAISRTVELGGGTTGVTTQLNVKALSDAPGEYYLALAGSARAGEEARWFEVQVGGKVVTGEEVVEDG